MSLEKNTTFLYMPIFPSCSCTSAVRNEEVIKDEIKRKDNNFEVGETHSYLCSASY